MFSKVLIANRGAIATRAERTLRAMGVQSVAVYAEADKDSLHVSEADEAIYLGQGSAATTYLDARKLLDAACQTGAEAIFPGYGFLSENADFARQCAAADITFIGPTPQQLELFGLKHVAREIAGKAGVPLVPGSELLLSLKDALTEAEKIGYPLMLKSTAGGGGIGITICANQDELTQAFAGAKHLAKNNFGNDGVFLERYVRQARHIEVQIFGTADEVVVLGERDCSVQRRNQKVVEECPAPNLRTEVRQAMFAAAQNLALQVGYRSAGTVEFLYDDVSEEFYFLEVNTRLQVEHGITEMCTGVDLVQWMLLEAAGEVIPGSQSVTASGHAIEVRLYAEDCLNGFLPATGKIDALDFDKRARVDTWICKGIEISSFYDPMLAKILVHADTRASAMTLMQEVLEASRVYGVTTNLLYLNSILQRNDYRTGQLSTQMLKDFAPSEPSIEVLDGGIQTTVQDYPGFVGYWAVGVPICGPMDSFSFRLGNAILGNQANAAGIETTLRGGKYRFRADTRFCLTGAGMNAKLNGTVVAYNTSILAHSGSVLELGNCEQGMRSYLCVAGGIDVPIILGSRSTFIDGRFGGHNGRTLRTGDVLRLRNPADDSDHANHANHSNSSLSMALPEFDEQWTLGVLIGPLSNDEFLLPEFFDTLTTATYTVGSDSARTGVRLNGPAPQWARKDGGDAGLHPSNIHDNPYSICALDLTGDQPILLGPDGPSLGGFVCPVVLAMSERWKLGQLRPGDKVKFQVLSPDQASARLRVFEQLFSQSPLKQGQVPDFNIKLPAAASFSPNQAILYQSGSCSDALCLRQSGEDCVLVEYGPMTLDIRLRFKVHVLMQQLQSSALPVVDLTPGVRSLQVHFDPGVISLKEVVKQVLAADASLPNLENIEVPSRIVHLPLSWDDPQTQLAARRYMETTRPDAPWCPSNPEFIRRINGLESIDDVYRIFFDASYLVLGLGDVYLGAPVATPVDPRHRLVTTKYNPARPWTPENAVGIGGSYLCVYGMEGPGGYQFVGRTTQMWNLLQTTESFKDGRPWLLDFFDQLRFYPVAADELLQMREDCLRGRFNVKIEKTTFKLGDYLDFLSSNRDDIRVFKEHQEAAFAAEHARWVRDGLDVFVSEASEQSAFVEEELPQGCVAVNAVIAGSVWKCEVATGQQVQAGQTLVVLESMKMEFAIEAPCNGIVQQIYTLAGSQVGYGQMIACIAPDKCRGAC